MELKLPSHLVGTRENNMKNIILLLALIFTLSACSEKRESDIDGRFGNGTETNPGSLQALPSNQTTNLNTPFNATVPVVVSNSNSAVFSITTPANHGNVSINSSTGVYNYNPDLNYVGVDSFSWQVEQNGQIATSTVSIIVKPANQPPVANGNNLNLNEDTPISGTATGTDPNGDNLTFTLTNQPQHGNIVFNSNGSFTYTPSLNYVGGDSFTFKTNDGSLDSNVATISLIVNAINDAPVASSSSFNTNEETSYSGTLSAFDVDSINLTYSLMTQPSHGTINLNTGTGAYTYTPNSNYSGNDSFTFKVNDGQLNSNNATVSIVVNPLNDAPVAMASNFTTNEDTVYNGLLSGLDPDGDAITYSIVALPTKGSVAISNVNLGTFIYTPNLNVSGSDFFTFKVNDGSLNSNVVTVSITINAVNDAPIANNSSFVVNAGGTYNGQALASDIDSPALTYILMATPSQGSVTLNTNGSYSYVANNNATGNDSFSFRVNDGQLDSNVATISVNFNTSNQPPLANNLTVNGQEDIPVIASVTGSDPENSSLTFAVVTGPSSGSVSLNSNGNFTYTPNLNFNGSDSFTFRSNDGQLNSNIATVSINLTSVNDAPVAQNGNFLINEDQVLNNNLLASDVDSVMLTYTIVTNPTKGSVAVTPAGAFTYTPNQNQSGSDSFTFKVNDGNLDSNIATISISIAPQNDAPILSNMSLTTLEDTGVSSNFIFSDPDGPSIGPWTILSGPNKGVVNITDVATGAFTYTPNANENGSDSFQVRVSDSLSNSNIATISISITPVNDAPVASNGSFSVNPGQSYSGALIASDVDGNSLTYLIVTSPNKGTIIVNPNTGSFTYQANLLSTGTDSFTFRVNDGNLNSNIATVSVNLNLVNQAPVALSQSFSTFEDTALSGQLSATDINGDSLTYLAVAQPANGILTVNPNGSFTYVPNANYNGSDSFTFKANDGQLDSNVATIFLNVQPVNDAPVALSQSYSVTQTQPFSGQTNATDVDSVSLTYSLINNVSQGVLTFNTNGSFTYTANANASGVDSFTFKANDGQLDSNIATISFNVNGFNQPPVANNISVNGTEDSPINGNLIGTDPNIGDVLTYSIVTPSSHGSISLNASTGAFVFTPSGNFNGSSSFTYKVNDGLSDSNIATVSITVSAVNDVPVANNQSITTPEDVPYNGVLTSSDVETSPVTYTTVTSPTNGTVSVNANSGAFSYTPNLNYNGADSFTFRVNDGMSNSNIATVSIAVTPVNDAPVANNQSIVVEEETLYLGNVTGSDVDGNSLTYSVVSSSSKGVLVLNTNGSFTYTPNLNTTGTDSFTFKANDGTVDSNVATVSIVINPNNDLPIANNQTFTYNEDSTNQLTLTGSDADNDPLTYIIVDSPSNGTLTEVPNLFMFMMMSTFSNSQVVSPNLIYTPNPNFNGVDSFTFKVNDGTGDSNVATVSINVNAVNDAPVADSKTITTVKNQAIVNLLTGSDVENSPIIYAIVANPAQGVVVLNPLTGTFVYTPNLNFFGNDSFTFKVNDSSLDSNIATVNIVVTNPNTPPVAQNGSYQLNEDQPYGGNFQAQDNEGNSLTYTVLTQPTNGVLTYNTSSGTFTYTPNLNFNGVDVLTFKVNDGSVDSNIATVNFTINAVNDMPIANNQSVSVNQNSTNNSITLTASDIDSPVLTYTLVAAPQHGTLSGTGANRVYTPTTNYTGPDFFTFKVNDGSNDSNVATVSINVNDLGGWCDPSYNFSQKLTINNQAQSSLSEFPIMVKLNTTRVNYADFKAGGADLRFYDSSCNLLAHEIERWNTSGESVIWVKVPNIPANNNTSFVRMHYGNPLASDVQNKHAVWSNEYVAVWHTEESSGTSISDSTSYANNLMLFGTPVQNTAGKVAGAELFNSSDDGYVEPVEKPSLRVVNNISLESWVYVTSCSGDDHVIEKYYKDGGSKEKDYALFVDGCKPKIRIGTKYVKYGTYLPLNQWIHIIGTFSTTDNTCKIYVNGVQVISSTSCTEELSGLGGYQMTMGNDYPGSNYFNGGVDEVRISKNTRSADWIKAQYMSMIDTYLTYGIKEVFSSF